TTEEPAPAPQVAEPMIAAQPEPMVEAEPRLEGASASTEGDADFEDAAPEAPNETVADSLFEGALEPGMGFEAEDEFLSQPAQPVQPQAKEEVRAGAVKEAPLESFFDQQSTFIASDIDRKIDEALQLAERMRQPQKKTQGPDELDVPAFL